MSGAATRATDKPKLALILGGGGARAAYQVGVLRGIARLFPELDVRFLTGISAGAINVAHLGHHQGAFHEKARDLGRLWEKLSFADVFDVDFAALLWRVMRVGLRLSVGMPKAIAQAHGMVDTQPLQFLLERALGVHSGPIPGIAKNIAAGRLSAVALTALNYRSGETITFVEGQEFVPWERPLRKGVSTRLTVDHVMASAALPLLFPSICVDGTWYGDGGIRMVAPLGPAIHLGADRMLVLSTHYAFPDKTAGLLDFEDPPSPALILGALYNAVFLDQLDQDILQTQRINNLVRALPPDQREGFRDVKTAVIRPSADLGGIANDFEAELPKTFRYFMRRFGSGESKSQDFTSTVMFHEGYIAELLRLGDHDAELHADSLRELIDE